MCGHELYTSSKRTAALYFILLTAPFMVLALITKAIVVLESFLVNRATSYISSVSISVLKNNEQPGSSSSP